MTNQRSLKNFWALIKNILRLIKITWTVLPLQIFFLVLLSIIIGATPFFAFKAMGNLIDSIILGINSGIFSAIWVSLAIYALLNILPAISEVFFAYFDRIYFLKIQVHFDIMVSKKRAEFDISQYEDPKFLDFLQRAFNGGYFPLINLTDGIMDLTKTIVGIFVGSAVALFIDWKVFLIVIISAIPLFIVEVRYGGQIWGIWAQNSPEQRRKQDLQRFFSISNKFDVIDGKLFQVHEKFLVSIKKILDDFTNKQLLSERGKAVYSLSATIIAAGGLFWGTALIIKSAIAGAIAIGTVVYAFQTLTRISGQTSRLLSITAKLLQYNLNVTDIFAVMDTKPVLKYSNKPKKINLTKEETPHIKFENVSFKYNDSESSAVKNINFEILPGEKIGLVGNNGSGKTTLVKLLLRIYDPTSGRITINDIDLKELDLTEWWKMSGVLLQDYATYNFAVKETIAIGQISNELNMPLIKKSAKQSTASNFINELTDQYDHLIGVEFGGIEPSKGQRQKLAIARALCREPKILILDEPTASIDSESSTIIFRELENLPKSISAILISHNFATIKKASKIIVLDQGQIIESGSHDELVSIKGKYAEAYEKQKKEYE